jgi:hypothetical protein
VIADTAILVEFALMRQKGISGIVRNIENKVGGMNKISVLHLGHY